jgi:DNA invertase Pin-like site-specific DNA recombinase
MEDYFPEEHEYRDEGCDLFPSCLNCPLPCCRYDDRGRRVRKKLRDEEILRLGERGKSVKELSQEFRISRRTVQRVLSRARREHE